MQTINTTFTDGLYHSVAAGPGEFRISVSKPYGFAYATSTPAATLLGHPGREDAIQDENLPASNNLYVQVRNASPERPYIVTVTAA